jgi:hypothetical protein
MSWIVAGALFTLGGLCMIVGLLVLWSFGSAIIEGCAEDRQRRRDRVDSKAAWEKWEREREAAKRDPPARA